MKLKINVFRLMKDHWDDYWSRRSLGSNYPGYKHDAWVKNRRINSNTKSDNRKVLELYDIILNNEYSDGDYWQDDSGNSDLCTKLSEFQSEDKEALERFI